MLLIGKSTISMAIFNSYVTNYQRVYEYEILWEKHERNMWHFQADSLWTSVKHWHFQNKMSQRESLLIIWALIHGILTRRNGPVGAREKRLRTEKQSAYLQHLHGDWEISIRNHMFFKTFVQHLDIPKWNQNRCVCLFCLPSGKLT